MAEYGIQIRDPVTGQIIQRYTDRISRTVGMVNCGPNAGSLYVPDSLEGSVFFITLTTEASFNNTLPSVITLSGRTISWTAGRAKTIMYGVY